MPLFNNKPTELPKSKFNAQATWQKVVAAQAPPPLQEKKKSPTKLQLIELIEKKYSDTGKVEFTTNQLNRKTKPELTKILKSFETQKEEKIEEPKFENIKSPIFKTVNWDSPIAEVKEFKKSSEEDQPEEDLDDIDRAGEFFTALNIYTAVGIELFVESAMKNYSIKGYADRVRKDQERFIRLWGDFYMENQELLEPLIGPFQQILLFNFGCAANSFHKKNKEDGQNKNIDGKRDVQNKVQ